jgi:hypothetical protein
VIFNKHSELEGLHAFLGASKYSWLRYDINKLEEVYRNEIAKQKGTELHELASSMIKHGVQAKGTKQTLNLFVNDAIGYKMQSEQVLYYSPNCFGTADAISFKNNFLRIHDLKTGFHPAKFDQLKIYAALFCLEYDYKPFDIKMELRIYQSDQVQIFEPDPDEIAHIMDLIVTFDKKITQINMEES